MTTGRGLEGAIAAQTAISLIDGELGKLTYRGYPATELAAHCSWEEVAYLLWEGELPSPGQLQQLKGRLEAARGLPDSVEKVIDALPAEALPMDVLRSAASALGAARPQEAHPHVDQAVEIAAQLPLALARFHRRRMGAQPVAVRPGMDQAALYLYLLTGAQPTPAAARALGAYLVLLADHGLNASTFAARVAASTQTDLYGAVTAAIATLKGPLHGGAPSLVRDMLEEIGTPDRAEAYLRAAIGRGERIMGFGHRVYKTTDPRAVALHDLAREVAEPADLAMAEGVESLALGLLEEAKPGRRLFTNVEYYSSAVMHAVGLPRDLFTASFAISRAAGWTAHVLEQVANNRLIRPQSDYVGLPERPLPASVASR
jgi:citrate synthase